MKRLNKLQRSIINRHIEAKLADNFDISTGPKSVDEIREALISGKTIKGLFDEIQFRFCSVTSIMLGSMNHVSQNYRKDIAKGFRRVFETLNIQ